MALADDITRYFRTDFKPAPGEFSRYDQQFLLQKFQVRERGRENGAKDLPESDVTSLDSVEQQLADAIQNQALEDERRTKQQLAHYDGLLKTANPAGESARMLAEADDAISHFRRAMVTARAQLDKARKDLIDREESLADFKRRNNLTRPAYPPKSHWTMSLILAICFFGETLGNTFILSTGSEYGLVGGFASAFLFTLLTMFFMFIAGFFGWTGFHHRSITHKLRGALVVLVCIAIFVGTTGIAAHYRIAITTGVPELQALAIAPKTLFANPLAFLDDVQSILMIGFAAMIGLIAMFDGYYWQDPYPGYARERRFYAQAHNAWIRLLHQKVSELSSIHGRYSRAIRDQQIQIANKQTLIPKDLANRRQLVIDFNAHLEHLQDVGRYLITNYREANVETRKTRKPKTFLEAWKVKGVAPIALPDESVVATAEQWQSVADHLLAASKALNRAHEEATGWIKELGTADSALDVDARKAREAIRTQLAAESSDDKSDKERPLLTVVESDVSA